MIVCLIVASCNKYEEGPSFSLRTKKARLNGEWQLESYYENGEDKTSSVASVYADFVMQFFKDGAYVEWYRNVPAEGTWTFVNNKSAVRTVINQADIDTIEIIRLTHTEFWHREENGNTVREYRWKAM
jgi:hypothetical protein